MVSKIVFPVSLGLVFVVVVGCGSNEPPTGTVRGSITFNGDPIKGGNINFYDKKTGIAARANLDEKGQFVVADTLKPGKYSVFVFPPDPPHPIMDNPTKPSTVKFDLGELAKIPDKYRSEITTDIQVEVKPGENTFDLKIAP